MDRLELDNALGAVPFLATLGVRVEEAAEGKVVLRLPANPGNVATGGALANAAIAAVAENAAAVAVALHPALAARSVRILGTDISYHAPSTTDVTAHAAIDPVAADTTLASVVVDGSGTLSVAVDVLGGHGDDVAKVIARFQVS